MAHKPRKLTCQLCETPFTGPPGRKFCSRACWVTHERTRGPRPTATCRGCGQPFKKQASVHVYCTSACSPEAANYRHERLWKSYYANQATRERSRRLSRARAIAAQEPRALERSRRIEYERDQVNALCERDSELAELVAEQDRDMKWGDIYGARAWEISLDAPLSTNKRGNEDSYFPPRLLDLLSHDGQIVTMAKGDRYEY